ncbi:hypothetical protein [Streptomyces sp. NPDC091217]|uniref:hypothetical protein n=1 Tax=Streptomyces sp. NPDC091217 TaxID=3365975 RepID=UPI00380932A2
MAFQTLARWRKRQERVPTKRYRGATTARKLSISVPPEAEETIEAAAAEEGKPVTNCSQVSDLVGWKPTVVQKTMAPKTAVLATMRAPHMISRHGRQPTDGSGVAVTRKRPRRIVRASVVLSALTAFASMATSPVQAALPGGNGSMLAGAVISGSAQGIATQNTDGSGLFLFTVGSGRLNQGQSPAWAPDGSRIVFESGEGGVESSLPDGSGSYSISDGVDRYPTFTADGAYVIASGDTESQQLEYTPSTWNASAHQGSSDMKPWFSAGTGGDDIYPTVSATTGTLYFEHDTVGAEDIWTDHGTHTAGLLISNGQQPDVSPDGTELAFVRSVSGYDQLFVQASDGSGTATQVTSGSANHDYPKWSPDGSTLYYNYNEGSDYSQITGHELVLATAADTETPNGLSFVTGQPAPAAKDSLLRMAETSRSAP